jgi:hypothetical protein
MASKYLQKYPVPQGFEPILHDFAREVLRDQPECIIEYAAHYFEAKANGSWKEGMYPSKFNIPQSQITNQLTHKAVPADQQHETSHYNALDKEELN